MGFLLKSFKSCFFLTKSLIMETLLLCSHSVQQNASTPTVQIPLEKTTTAITTIRDDSQSFLSDSTQSESQTSLERVEEILRYEFKNKKLLQHAFTHSSYLSTTEESYERLEYVGDAVLNLLFAKEHYSCYPESPPGTLTRLRAVNVDTEKLARAALKHGLHKYLRHSKPLLADQIQEFEEMVMEYPLHSMGLIKVPKALADLVESLIGAVFIDSDSSLDIVWTVCKLLLEPLIVLETMTKHPMSELHELCQKHGLRVEFIRDVENDAVKVLINNHLVGKAAYDLKKKKEIAQNNAAKDALYRIKNVLHDISSSELSELITDIRCMQ